LADVVAVNFKYVKAFTSSALKNLTDNSPKLRKIKLANNSLTNDDLTYLLRFGNIKDISWMAMNLSTEFSPECFKELMDERVVLWKLKVLDFSQNTTINDATIEDLCDIRIPYLSYLSLESCKRLTIESLVCIALANIGRNLYTLNFNIEGVSLERQDFELVEENMKRLGSLILAKSSKNEYYREFLPKIEISLL
jgi:hypothetical protein